MGGQRQDRRDIGACGWCPGLRKPTPTSTFLYSLAITALAFIFREPRQLAAIGIPNGLLGFSLGFRRSKWIILLFAIAIWGTFLNALIVANTGDPVIYMGPLEVRMGALNATLTIGLRLLAIAGAALIFFSSTSPRDLIRHLEAELRLPKGLAFSIAYSLRLFPLMQRDFREIQLARLERGYRRLPITPTDVRSIMLPLLSVGYERAIWTGIGAELRGFASRKVRMKVKFGLPELMVSASIALQIIIAFIP
ncbi:MAG: energy-coupling factor transporter transmembrane component T [Candidatus Bathyarchaeia archaeon]